MAEDRNLEKSKLGGPAVHQTRTAERGGEMRIVRGEEQSIKGWGGFVKNTTRINCETMPKESYRSFKVDWKRRYETTATMPMLWEQRISASGN
jgi:hypothetical protein